MRKNLIFISLFVTSVLFGQEKQLFDVPSLGDQVKDFSVRVVQKDKPAKTITLSSLKGKVVILEFWATYCRPCLPAMDHLGELQKLMPDKLQVLSITDEDNTKVQTFLTKRPTDLQIGLDVDKKLNDMFYHQFMPHTVVLDTNGVLKAVTSPDQITAEVISKIYSGVDVAIKPKAEFAPTEEGLSTIAAKEIESLFKLSISGPREGIQSQINPKSETEFEFINCTIPLIYRFLYQLNRPKPEKTSCLEVTEKTKYLLQQDQVFCFNIKVPEAIKSSLGDIGIRAIDEMFGIKPRFENRNRKVYALVADQKSTFKDPATGLHLELGMLLKTLEGQGLVDLPILNESGFKDDSVVFVERMPKEVEAVEGTLAKLGFRLIQKERNTGCIVLYDMLAAQGLPGQQPAQPALPAITTDLIKNEK